MEKYQLDRLMSIAQKTNSPVIVLDEDGQEMVVLPLDAYEEMLDCLSGEEFDPSDDGLVDIGLDEFEGGFEPEEELNEFAIEPSELDLSDVQDDLKSMIEENIDLGAENSAQIDAEPAEEQFYLEPVE